MSDISLSCWKQVMSHDIKFMFDGLGFQKFLCLPSCFLLCVIGHANLGYFRAPCLANLTGQSSLLRLQLRERNVWRAVRRRTVEHKWGRYLLPRLDQKKKKQNSRIVNRLTVTAVDSPYTTASGITGPSSPDAWWASADPWRSPYRAIQSQGHSHTGIETAEQYSYAEIIQPGNCRATLL